MIHISHRGNINGKIVERENSPEYIQEAVTAGYFCEVDVWHDNDDYTLTSMGWVWAYPGMERPCENSIAVLPEIHNTNTENFWGICSDYIERYK